jgi:hypothetical protein
MGEEGHSIRIGRSGDIERLLRGGCWWTRGSWCLLRLRSGGALLLPFKRAAATLGRRLSQRSNKIVWEMREGQKVYSLDCRILWLLISMSDDFSCCTVPYGRRQRRFG